jgi:chromosomal replication initiator protein
MMILQGVRVHKGGAVMNDTELWRAVSGQMEMKLSKANFGSCFKDLSVVSRSGDTITLRTTSVFTRGLIQQRIHKDLIEALKDIDGIANIEYVIGKKGDAATKKPSRSTHKDSVELPVEKPTKPQQTTRTSNQHKNPVLNPKYTFDTFVVGGSNELAYAACIGVSKNPGNKYNPLYLYGGVGLGKTHLMQAVGNAILKDDPSKRIEYITSEAFTNEFVESIQHKTTTNFAKKFRNVDVLIIDDMQFLSGKEKTQEEFFHTFNALHQANKQIIISSDRPPRAISHLDDRLRSRFESGMTADVQSPDLETRTAILQKKAASQHFILPQPVANYMAENIKQNIRELEGALTQIIAICEVRGIEPTVPLVSQMLGSIIAKKTKKSNVSPKTVIEKVASYYDLKSDDITGPKRGREIVVPRQIAMYIMRHELNLSFPKIASAVGGRDHTTAMHSVDKVEKQIEHDEMLREEIQQVCDRVLA